MKFETKFGSKSDVCPIYNMSLWDTSQIGVAQGSPRITALVSGGDIQIGSYITANIYCKSRNLPKTDVRNYSIDLR